jgi:hypothetical protein
VVVRCLCIGLALLTLTLAGCGTSARKAPATTLTSPSVKPSTTLGHSRQGTVAMMNLPKVPASRCRATPLRPVCPRVIPRVPYRLVDGHVAGGILHGFVVTGPRHVNQFWVFDLQHGVPSDSRPQLNRPPGVLHMTSFAGNVSEAVGMPFPSTRRNTTLRSGIVAGKRTKPLLFGSVMWSGHQGALFLAPSYPFGGEIGGHLTFWWRAHGTNYLISIHAWEPLTECAKVLRAMVASASQ